MKLSKTYTTVTPFSKFLSLALFLIFPFVGFYLGFTYEDKLEHLVHPVGPRNRVIYSGVLPCADCTRLDTTIIFYQKIDPFSQKYISENLYEGKIKKPIITKGIWTVVYGTRTNPNALVYVLDPDKPNETQYFLQTDPNHIQMLDRNMNLIQSPFNQTLSKR